MGKCALTQDFPGVTRSRSTATKHISVLYLGRSTEEVLEARASSRFCFKILNMGNEYSQALTMLCEFIFRPGGSVKNNLGEKAWSYVSLRSPGKKPLLRSNC